MAYEEKNMTEHPELKEECEKLTGQSKCPTINIDGHWILDGDADQLETYLKEIEAI